MPKLSAIVSVRAAAADLALETLDSALGQSLDDLEVVCVCDGPVPDPLRARAAQDPRVRALEAAGASVGAARNLGLAGATGDYVHFLDAGDRVLPWAYEVVVRKAERRGADVVRCAGTVWDEARGCHVGDPRATLEGLRPGDFGRVLGAEGPDVLLRAGVETSLVLWRRAYLEARGLAFAELEHAGERPLWAAVVAGGGRLMVERDRLCRLWRAGTPRKEGAWEARVSCQCRAFELVGARCAADGAPAELCERVLAAEAARVGELLRECAAEAAARLGADRSPAASRGGAAAPLTDDPELARALGAALDLARASDAPFSHLLRAELRDVRADLARHVVARPLPEARPERPSCAHPKVTVAVPVCNVEDYLSEALHSLVTQTLDDIEFVCVDDGSTDGSAAILREFAALDGRIRVLSGPNGGYGHAMNRAIDAARGDYLGILEPDDFVPPAMYAELLAEAERSRADLVKADFHRFAVGPDGELVCRLERLSPDASLYGRVLRPLDEQRAFQLVMNTWSGIYSVSFLRRWHIRHNETPGASYQDNGFWFKTFCRAERALFVRRPYYMNRRDNPNSSMFSRGKMWCVTEEYRLIGEWLDEDPVLRAQVEPIFYQKKLSNLMVTYRRLAPELQGEYLCHIRDELAGPLERGLVSRELVGEALWQQLAEIVADPVAYHERVRVSVVMPVHDDEAHLRETLDGLLVRNEVAFELICVDDGSTDGSLAILREYEARDARVRVTSQANAGAGAARNAGMALARGEYLAFLDADDIYDPSMLRQAYDRGHAQGADVVVVGADEYHDDTGAYVPTPWTIHDRLLPAERPFSADDVELDLFKAFVGWPWDKLFRREFVVENGLRFQEIRTSNDMLFVFSAVARAERITVVRDVLAHHRKASGTLSVTREQSWWFFHEALLALRAQLREWGLWDVREQDFVNYALHACLWNLHSLRGPAYHELYDALRGGWLEELGVAGRPRGYFYAAGEWESLQKLVSLTSEEYLFWRLGELGRRPPARAEDAEATHELAAERRRADRLARELERVRASTGWRVGRALTWPFRALKRRLQDGPARG